MSITETITVNTTPVQTRTIKRFLFPNEFGGDQGLIMLLDSKIEQRKQPLNLNLGSPLLRTPLPQTCGSSSVTLSTSSLLQSTQNYYVKSLFKINILIQTQLFPFLLYVSLLLLAFQTAVILTIFATSLLPRGIWFLLSCGLSLGFLFCYTSQVGLSSIPTPPPTPSHSSASLHS